MEYVLKVNNESCSLKAVEGWPPMITVPYCTEEQLNKLLGVLKDPGCSELYFVFHKE